MKKFFLAIACLSLITISAERRHSSQSRYSGKVTDSRTVQKDTLSSRQKELTIKRQWSQMEEDLEKAGFKTDEITKIKKLYYDACRRAAHALEQNS
jgi:hypothetical protein